MPKVTPLPQISHFAIYLHLPTICLLYTSDVYKRQADGYLTVYLCGSVFVMVGLGMNSFINSQGFGKMGMMTVLLGAVTNILLDPLFIFVLHMGVQGAALATVISQFLSAAWVFRFLTGKKAIYRLQKKTMKLDWKLVGEIVSLGMSSFCFAITNSLVQIVCNINLQQFGGDLYVGIMTVANSVREVVSMPMNGLTNGAQPVIGYNYGAREYRRVRSGIRFMSVVCVVSVSYTHLDVYKRQDLLCGQHHLAQLLKRHPRYLRGGRLLGQRHLQVRHHHRAGPGLPGVPQADEREIRPP